MCSLCGILGCDDHWSSAIARPDVYTRNTDRVSRRREAARRRKIANAILAVRRLKLSAPTGTSYVLTNATGRSQVFEALAHLWPEADRMSSAGFDPLDEDFLTALERAS
ncbi:hypothetical protein [Jiella pacifica]|uniref:Uncharacterized protein n=1 Tax=Jiella pacifica TaxID=2696469 RepID=A0A6N9SZI5_9HYPH|nr:hypothetical protein [Jiella pacifica]NDW03176.1 hypothetical protein [Jiella pacifica]